MNRFRTKKKAKEDQAVAPRSSSEDQPSSSFFRRNKKAPEEEKKDLDLASALPSTDEFRTSLLMTGLSARFSMLREQDDPNTKIGKASDDSVLFPKRQSRLMELGFRGLDDIAEVESIRAPPTLARAGSYNSDSDSAQGSIMNRTRPGEGNVLFGGRQKIYRIPAGSGSGGGGAMSGRALYDDDVALSAFQKFKLTEKNRLDTLGFDGDDDNNNSGSQRPSPDASLDVPPISTSLSVNDSYDSSSPSPFLRSDSPSPTGYNLRRETSSTTSSGARNSTAATSVISQPAVSSAKDWQLPSLSVSGLGLGSSSAAGASSPASATSTTGASTLDRAGTTSTRSRRLYEQGLTQDMHEHQSSALSRIDTLSGKRTLGSRTPDFNQPSSPTALSDRLDRFGSIHSATSDHRRMLAKASAPNLRSISPPTSDQPSATATPSLLPADIATLKTRTSFADAKAVFSGTPPLSPPMSDSGEHPLLPIQPGDRGKATAMGVFQKPSLPYDESRFAQRQLQMQQGRETPTRRFRAESNASHATGLSSRSSSAARQPPPPTSVPTPAPDTASQPVSQRNSGTEAEVDGSSSSRPKTFLFDDDEEESPAPAPVPAFSASMPPAVTLQRPSDLDHPAFRQAAAASELAEDSSTEPTAGKDSTVDSPTLGPNTGLSGLVKQHLRSISNASSVYSTMSPPANDFPDNTSGSQNDLGMFQSLDLNLTKPWNGDRDWMSSVSSPPKTSEAPKALAESRPGPAPTNALPPMPRRREHREVPESDRSSDDFSKTGDEDDFASQLANARRRVQERLTTYVESDTSRNTSPLLAPTDPALPLPPKSNPLGILRGKSSRGSLMERPRDVSQPNKALKLLGIGPAAINTTPGSAKQSFEDVAPPMPSMPLAAASVSSIPAVVNTQAVVEREAPVSQPEKQERRDHRGTTAGPAPVSAPSPVPVSQPAPVETVAAASAGAATVAESDVDTDKDDDVNVHPGLRAFRNARRQLQKRKELETLARHGDAATADGPGEQQAQQPQQSPPNARERRGMQQSTPIRDRKPPPVFYQQRGHSEESQRTDMRQSSQTERDRSGSDSSNGSSGRARHAPEKLRLRQDEYHMQQQYQQQQQGTPGNQHLGTPRHGAGVQLRSPGLPGTDIRRSPYQPPQAYASSPALRVGNGYDSYSAQPSPISPIGNGGAGLPAPAFYSGGGGSTNGSAATTPTSMGPRMQQQQRGPLGMPPAGSVHTTSTLNDSMKRTVNKNDISEPTFLMSTSRVPTVSLPQNVSAPDAADGNGSRSRSGSRSRAGSNAGAAGYAPPLPPINPLRNKQSGSRGPRGMISGLMGRRNEHDEGDQSVAASDDEGSRPGPRVLRKKTSDAGGMRSRMGSNGQQRMDLPGGMI